MFKAKQTPQTSIQSLEIEQTPLSSGINVGRQSPIQPIPGEDLQEYYRKLAKESFEKGGMITGGKFSHETNPIDIVQKGKKVGEMTGGEVILNPSQAAKLSKESAYFRKLLNKFNKSK
jgi:general stress protein YciG